MVCAHLHERDLGFGVYCKTCGELIRPSEKKPGPPQHEETMRVLQKSLEMGRQGSRVDSVSGMSEEASSR